MKLDLEKQALEVFRAERIKQGLSAQQLADRMGISRDVVANYESGRVKNLSLNMFVEFAKALGLSYQVNLEVVEYLPTTVQALKSSSPGRRSPGLDGVYS